MKCEIGWEAVTCDPDSVVTVGTFDGVHRGHQAILRYLVERATDQGGTSTLLSFDPHPRSVVHEADVPLLTTVDERAAFVAAEGVDRLVSFRLPRTLLASMLAPTWKTSSCRVWACRKSR